MNRSLKDCDFFQSESSPSFKNLRIDGDSPTKINFLQQKLLSQQSIISPLDTPTMNKTGSFKSNKLYIRTESKDKQNENKLNIQQDEKTIQQNLQNKQFIQNSQENNSTTASGKQKNKSQIDDNSISLYELSNNQQLQKLSKLNQNRLSDCLSEFKMSETNDLQLQNFTRQSGEQYSNSSSKQGEDQNSKRNNSKDKVENKIEICQKLVYNRELECKYNPQQQRYSGNCNIHNYELLNFVCFTCNELLCNECINIHIQHQIQSIKNSYPVCKETIQESLKSLSKKIEQLLIRSEDLTSIQNDIIEVFQQQKHEIQRCYKRIIEQIKMKSNELLEFCSKLYNEKLDYVIKEHTQIRKGLNSMIQSHSIIEQNIALQDPFITCDYYVKKLKFINQISQDDTQESSFFAQISPLLGSLNNKSFLKQKSIYQIFPYNNRLQINNKRIQNQIEREYTQQKINLTNYNFSENANKLSSFKFKCSQEDDNKNTVNKNNILNFNESNKYSTNNNIKNDFMSLQSSPLSKQSISNKTNNQNQANIMNQQNYLNDLTNDNKNQLNYFNKIKDNNILSQNNNNEYFNNMQRQNNIFQKNNIENKYHNQDINDREDKYYLSERNNIISNYNQNQFNSIKQNQIKDKISNIISQKYFSGQDTSDLKRLNELQYDNGGLNKYLFNISNQLDIIKQIPPNSSLSDLSINSIPNQKLNNSYSTILNQYNSQNKDDILNQNNTSNFNNISDKIINPSCQNTCHIQQKINNVHISKHIQNNLSNNSSACSSSTRVPAPISKTPSPNKIKNDLHQERKNMSFLNSKENKLQSSSSKKDKPFCFLNSDKTEKETSPKYIAAINQQKYSHDDKAHQQLYKTNLYNQSKYDLYSSEKYKYNSSNGDLNDDSSNMQKINKEIEEIKHLLNQSSINQQEFLSKSQLKKNKFNSKDFKNTCRQSFSATHSPIKDSSDKKSTQFLNNFNIFDSSQSNQLQKSDRSKSPNFFKADRYYPKQNSINSPNSNPNSQTILSSLYNQVKSEKILNSSFQLEGFLNSIRKNDRQFQKPQIYNLDNKLQLQQQTLSSPSQQQNISNLSKNNQQQPNLNDVQPIRSSSIHQQQEDSPLHKLSKERFTEKLIQNLQKFRQLNNQNCTDRDHLADVKKDY